MAEQKKTAKDTQKQQPDAAKTTRRDTTPQVPDTPKTESSSEYEGAKTRNPTGNQPVEVKTETSSGSGE